MPDSTESNGDRALTLSVDQAAELLGVSPGLVYRQVRQGELTAVRLGRRVLIPRHAVDELLGRGDPLPAHHEPGQ